MEVKISHLEGVKFAIQARSHVIVCDQPLDNGGEDSGITQPELLLASLGACAAYYALQFLKTRNLAQTGVEVSVTAEKLSQPARLGNFHVQVMSPVPLSAEQTEGIKRSVQRCLIHNTLLSLPEIRVELTISTAAAVS
jgi:uncharacterized OsmC-like protein